MAYLRKVLLSGIGLCVFGTMALAYADNGKPVAPAAQAWKHGNEGFQEIYSKLHLTDAQKKQLEDNKTRLRAQMKSTREQVRTNREAMQQELMKDALDMKKIHDIHNRIKALEAQMADDRLDSFLAVRTILTPQQFAEFTTLTHHHKPEPHARPHN